MCANVANFELVWKNDARYVYQNHPHFVQPCTTIEYCTLLQSYYVHTLRGKVWKVLLLGCLDNNTGKRLTVDVGLKYPRDFKKVLSVRDGLNAVLMWSGQRPWTGHKNLQQADSCHYGRFFTHISPEENLLKMQKTIMAIVEISWDYGKYVSIMKLGSFWDKICRKISRLKWPRGSKSVTLAKV